MESGKRGLALSSGRPHRGNAAQTSAIDGPGSAADSGLEAAALAPGFTADGVQRHQVGATPHAHGNMGGATGTQPRVEVVDVGNQPRVTRARQRMALALASASRIRASNPFSAATAMSAHLVAYYAWSDRTTRSRNSQWSAWLQFCAADDRSPLPVTEADMVSFVGWLALERQAGRRSVSATSLPQYFSAVRQMQMALTGILVPSYPFLKHVARGYEKWKADNYPAPTVRMGIDAAVVQRIWELGKNTDSSTVLRVTALIVFAFSFNGLRESSVLSIETAKLHLQDDHMTVRLSVWKGKRADHLPLIRYHRVATISSPLDLWHKWNTARASHVRFFALPGESNEWNPTGLTKVFQNVLEALDVSPRPNGKFTSHSRRIGAHTEQILIGIPLEVRLSRFGWGHDSQSMAALYFDRTIRVESPMPHIG